jgi:hypothetical protein
LAAFDSGSYSRQLVRKKTMAAQKKASSDNASKLARTEENKQRRILKNNGPEALARWKSEKLRRKVHG